MKTAARNVIALVVGLVAGSLVNMALVMLGPIVVPPPAGVNMSDAASFSSSMHLLQPRHFVFPLLAHAFGTFTGAAVAFRVAVDQRWAMAWIIGVIFLAGGIAASTMIPAPTWFIVLDLLCAYLPFAWLGGRVASRGINPNPVD